MSEVKESKCIPNSLLLQRVTKYEKAMDFIQKNADLMKDTDNKELQILVNIISQMQTIIQM